jgi:hypothetical protein
MEWLKNTDPERSEMVERALNVGNVGSVLLQTEINKVVQQLTLCELGAQALLERKPGSGDAVYINRRTAGVAGGVWVADTATATEESGSYAQVSFGYKTLLSKVKVTRKAAAQAASYGDALAIELQGKVEDFAANLEDALFNGDSAVTAAQIDGMFKLIGAVSGQVVANSSAAAGDDLTLAKLDEAIDAVKGAGNRNDLLIFGSFAGIRKVNAALQAQQAFNDMVEVDGGFRVRSYDGIPLITSTGINDDMEWSGSAIAATSGESTNPTTALVIVNKRHIYMSELNAMTVMPVAQSTSQFSEVELYNDLALVYANTLGGAILGGLS